MKFTLSWLKEHLQTDAGVDEIVERMTMTGLEVEGVENAGEKLKAFTVARPMLPAGSLPIAWPKGTSAKRNNWPAASGQSRVCAA